jgi:hypothetical protein
MNEISIDVSELRKRKIFIATPMYGGQCGGQYTRAIIELQKICSEYEIQTEFFFLFNESLITRARNYCADEFMRSDYTHLMFIDSDIGFNPHDVLALAALADPESDKDIVCGPYPKKVISWEKIKRAVDKGFADENPQKLANFVGDFVFNPADDRPEFYYKPDHIRSENFDGTREIMAYFDCVICPDSKRYLSEDYMFCQWARKADIKVWMAPWMQLNHTGSYQFGGSLIDIAQIGVSATADPREKLK